MRLHGEINNERGSYFSHFGKTIWYVKGGLDCSTFKVFNLLSMVCSSASRIV